MWWAVALVLAVMLPQAAALEATGSFAVAGDIQFPEGTAVHGAPLVVFRNERYGGPLALADFEVHAETLRVSRHRSDGVYADTGVMSLGTDYQLTSGHADYTLHNVTVRLVAEDAEGHLALEAAEGARFAFFAGASVAMEARHHTVLASGDSADGRGAPTFSYYRNEVAKEHLLLSGPGRVHVEGPARLVVYGLTVSLDADENQTEVDTGPSPSRTGAGTSAQTWLVLEADGLSADLSSRGAWQVAAKDATVEWTGPTVFRCIRGELSTSDGRYAATPRPVSLEGAFVGALWPEGKGRAVYARLEVQGELSRTTLEAAADAVVPRAPGPSLLPWLAVGAAVAVAGAGGALAWRRGARPPPAPEPVADAFAAEECVDKADELIQRGAFDEALGWITHARRLAPTSASVCATQAFLLGEAGRVDDAIAAYREASRLAPAEAEYALNAARLAHQAGRPAEVVEDLLEQALARDPAQIPEVERDGFFRDLASRPRYEHMAERAWARFVADLSGPDDEA